MPVRSPGRRAAAVLLCVGVAGCASPAPGRSDAGLPAGTNILVVTQAMELVRVRASEPAQVLEAKRLLGFAPGEQVAGISFRVARGTLYALTTSGRLYSVETSSGIASPVGLSPVILPLEGTAFGLDFNPLTDRIRVVSSSGQNLRMHPDTGATIDGDVTRPGVQPDAPLHYGTADPNAARTPHVMALAFTPSRVRPQVTTLYAIDGGGGLLATLGGANEGAGSPLASSGELQTVGPLGLGETLDATMDIADRDGLALAAIRTAAEPRTTLFRIDLVTGRASPVGTLLSGAPVLGMAIEP